MHDWTPRKKLIATVSAWAVFIVYSMIFFNLPNFQHGLEWWIVCFSCIVVESIDVNFPLALFKLDMLFKSDNAEPSDFYLAMQKFMAKIIPIAALICMVVSVLISK